MSGGALDYPEWKLEEIALTIAAKAKNPLHRALSAHLMKVKSAVHALEWELSGDTAEGDADAEIRALLGPAAELAQVVAEARTALLALDAALNRATGCER